MTRNSGLNFIHSNALRSGVVASLIFCLNNVFLSVSCVYGLIKPDQFEMWSAVISFFNMFFGSVKKNLAHLIAVKDALEIVTSK